VTRLSTSSQRAAKAEKEVFHKASLLDICLEDNPYLRTGFREMAKEDTCACLRSTFELHNETMNIWTHGLAFLMFAGLIVENFLFTTNMDFYDRLVFQVYLACVSTCFSISAFYHIFRNYSVNAYANWLVADINGVGLYIFGSVFLVGYFRFWCHDIFRWFYLTIDVLLYLSFAISMPSIVKYKLFNLRTWLFGLLSILGLTAHIHADILEGFFEWHTVIRNAKLVWVAVCVIGSMVIRNKKIPEKWYPGRFDIFFASHQIFHVLVWLGMCILYSVFYAEFGPGTTRSCPTV